MPKNSRGGRRATSVASGATTSMGGNSATGPVTFAQFMDPNANNSDIESIYEPSVVDAIKQYISTKTDSSGYSMAQNLNYKLENDLPLNVNEKFMLKYMQKGMKPIGQNTILYRGCHDDVLEKLGIRNYWSYSEGQLNQMLKGATFANKCFTSTSYDKSKNPFYTGPNSGGREVEMVIKTPASAKMVYGARKQTEVVLDTNTQFKITGVKYTGRTATPRNSRSKPVIELEVEVV